MPRDGELREGLQAIAHAIKLLGNADAATPMGGLEALGKVILESNGAIADAISELAEAVNNVADAIANR
ncbi:MAG: hypothetical protein ACM3US_02415 [Sphingomonadaceae bacterium]